MRFLENLDRKIGMSQRAAGRLPVPRRLRIWLVYPLTSLSKFVVPALAVFGAVVLIQDGISAVRGRLSAAYLSLRAKTGL